jgi:very-short-patch-repair endonuclease
MENQEFELIFISESDTDKSSDILSDKKELANYSYISNGLYFEYFVGYEITALLGYKNPAKTINDNISKCNRLEFRDYPGVKEPELDPRTILISRDGAIEILIKTRKRISPDVLHILKSFGIDTTNRKCLTKEQQTLSALTNTFKTEKFEDQFKIGRYYLDLYFTDYKIVVECDENGHSDRKPGDERERMDYVNEKLEITDLNWIRYNPDEKDFDISKVMGQIYIKINLIKNMQIQKEIYELQNNQTPVINDQFQIQLQEQIYQIQSQMQEQIKQMQTQIEPKRKRRPTTEPTTESIELSVGAPDDPDHNFRTPKKQCCECKLNLSLSKYYFRNNLSDYVDIEPKNFEDYTEDELKHMRSKYRSSCKKCCNKKSTEIRNTLKKDPNFNKSDCKSCNTIFKNDFFYINEDKTVFDECIVCYIKNNNLPESKQCIDCLKILPLSGYHVHTGTVLRNQCKTCRNTKKQQARKSVICEFCNAEIKHKENLAPHQETESCKKAKNLKK